MADARQGDLFDGLFSVDLRHAGRMGVLPSQMIRQMMGAGYIKGSAGGKLIQPASLDLRLSGTIFRLDGVFLPRTGETIEDGLKRLLGNDLRGVRHSPGNPLERNVAYIAELMESLHLPQKSTVSCFANPKSSSGRNNVQGRVVADGVARYDAPLIVGDQGGIPQALWTVIQPRSFAVKVSRGLALAQVRFVSANSRFTETDLQVSLGSDKLLFDRNGKELRYEDIHVRANDGSITLTLDLSREIVGWECLGKNRVLDLSQKEAYDPNDYFRPLVREPGDCIHLKQGAFYIFMTRERVRVPPHLACEMRPMDPYSGEFRAHFAGFVDPGWGWGKGGEGIGRPLVCEVIPYEDLIWEDGQPIARIGFEKMVERPQRLYDQLTSANYRTEFRIPRLSKQFKQD